MYETNEMSMKILEKLDSLVSENQKILQKLDELAEENKQLKSELEEVKEQQQKTKEFVKELAEEMVMLLGKFIKEQNKKLDAEVKKALDELPKRITSEEKFEVFRNWFENTITKIIQKEELDSTEAIVNSALKGHRLILDSITELNKKLDKVEYEVKKIRDPLHAMRDKNGDFSLFNRVR
jgi:outer membrane murein-binding lipoprotein Lpp